MFTGDPNADHAARGIWRLIQIQFKILFWFLGLVFRLVSLGYVTYKGRKPEEQIDLSLPIGTRFEHTHIVAGSGHGKTELIKHMIETQDLEGLTDANRSVIVLDSQGDLLKAVSRLAELSPSSMGSISSRVVLIDPNDIENPPCLNLFDFGLERIKKYSPVEQEKLVNGAIALYEYMFGALLGAELTQRKG